MKKRLAILVVLMLYVLFPSISALAAPTLDLTFQTKIRDNALIYEVKEQVDGKLIISGYFSTVNGVDQESPHLVRMNRDGSLDSSFAAGTGPDEWVSVEILADGKMVVYGALNQFNGTPSSRMALLNPDGSLHTAFDVNNSVKGVNPLSNGDFMVYGWFTSINGAGVNYIARINNDGSLDPSFSSGAARGVEDCHIQNDGKMILESGTSIIRLHADGSLDPSFDAGEGPAGSGTIKGSLLQQDGKILAWGNFTRWNGADRIYAVRLNGDGSLDTGFDSPLIQNHSYERVEGMLQQSSGGILLHGVDITTKDGQVADLVRLNPDGSLDDTFDNSHAFSYMQVGLRDDDAIIVVSHSEVFRLDKDGNENLSFTQNTGSGADKIIRGLELLENRDIVLIGGAEGLTSFNGYPRTRLAILNETGAIDVFHPVMERPGQVTAHWVQDDGKIIIGGDFRSVDGAARNKIARLNPDGSLDAGFTVGSGIESTYSNGSVDAVACQDSGKILVGGSFDLYDGSPADDLVRLNEDGSLNRTYAVSGGRFGVQNIVVSGDDKAYVGGYMSEIDGIASNKVARLNGDGSVDTGFYCGITAGYNDAVHKILEQPDKKILACGRMPGGIVRLNQDGSSDTAFNPAGTGDRVLYMALAPDGKILLGLETGTAFLIHPDGSLDSSFELTQGYTHYGYAMAVLPGNQFMGGGRNQLFVFDQNGNVDVTSVITTNSHVRCIRYQGADKLIIGGEFSQVSGVPMWGLARLNLDPAFSGQIRLDIAGHNGLTVKNAVVSLEGTAFSTTTDDNGNFELPGVPAGSYTLQVTAPDLVPFTMPVTVGQGMTPVSVTLQGGSVTQDQLDQAVFEAEQAKEAEIGALTGLLEQARQGDLDGDGDTDADDLASFAGHFGR